MEIKEIKKENIDQEKQETEIINTPKKENDTLIEEEDEIVSFLKAYLENIMEILSFLKACLEYIMEIFGKICLFFGEECKYEPEIQKQNDKFKIEYKREMDEFERERREIIREKQESIRKIHIERRNRIKQNDEKYNQVLSYLDSIKNDKDKLIEFLKRKNIF
jgi:1,4-alpha-glucan branching enzyme